MDENKDVDAQREEDLQTIFGLKFHVSEVKVNGLGRTKDDIVCNAVKPVLRASTFGEVIKEAGVAEGRLRKLGCFNNVNVRLDSASSSEQALKVVFDVVETGLYSAKVQQQVGFDEFSLMGNGALRNVWGRGEEVSASYSRGAKRTNFELAGLKRLHGPLQAALRVNVFQQLSDAAWAGFRQTDKGAQLQGQCVPLPGVTQRATLEGVWRQLDVSRDAPFCVREDAGHSLKTALRHEIERDTRDHPVFPGHGSLLRLTTELAGAPGNVSFLKNNLDATKNLTLACFPAGDIVAHASVSGGVLVPLAPGRPSCVADRFVVGGLPRLAGWLRGGLGRAGEGRGVEAYAAACLRLTAPIPLLPPSGLTNRLRLYGFFNAVNTADGRPDTLPAQLSAAPRSCCGAGLAYNLLDIARLELYWSVPLVWRACDSPAPGLGWGLSVEG